MADVKPLKLEFDGNGTPSGIGEFTSGDTIETAIVDLSMSGLTDVSSTILPSTGDSLVYTGSIWSASSITHPDTFSNVIVTTALSAGPSCNVEFDGDVSISGNLSGAGNIGVIGQIMCGQTGIGTADLNVVDDNSNATVEINSGANYDSKIQFRENNAWRCDMGWDGGDNDFFLKTYTGDINLHPYAGYTVSANCSSITVSSCPVPPPWSFTEIQADDGTNSATAYYFANGSTQAKTEIDAGHITWDSTNSYFTIANAGYYEFEMQGSVIVASSPTTVTTSIIQTTGLGGTEVEKIDKAQVVRTNIDPHDIMIKWVGYCAAANFTCKIDGDNAVLMNKGSTFTCKRIN